MKRIVKHIVACLLTASLAFGLTPGFALAESGGSQTTSDVSKELSDKLSHQGSNTVVGEQGKSVQGSTNVYLIGRDMVDDPEPIYSSGVLYNDLVGGESGPKIDFQALVSGVFADGSFLNLDTNVGNAHTTFVSEAAATSGGNPYVIAKEVQLTVTDGKTNPCIQELDKVMICIGDSTSASSSALYDKLVSLGVGNFRVVALEDGASAYDLAGVKLVSLPEESTAPVHYYYYIEFPKSVKANANLAAPQASTTLGSYAIMYPADSSTEKATVTAKVKPAADGSYNGKVSPSGTATYVINPAVTTPSSDGVPANAVRYTFYPEDEYAIDTVTVTRTLGGSTTTVLDYDAAVSPTNASNSLSGVNFYDVSLLGSNGATFEVTVSFAKVEITNTPVALRAVADGPGSVSLSVDGANMLTQTSQSQATFKYGSATSASISGSGIKVTKIEAAEVASAADVANVPAASDSAWKTVSSNGNAYNISALTKNTIVKFTYVDGETDNRESFMVDASITKGEGKVSVQNKSAEDATAALKLGDTAVIDIKPSVNWGVGKITITEQQGKGTPVSRDLSGAEFDRVVKSGQLTLKDIDRNYTIAVELVPFNTYYISTSTRGGSITINGDPAPKVLSVGANTSVADRTVLIEADPGYVIDPKKTLLDGKTITVIANSSTPLISQPVALPYTETGSNHTLKVAFKKSTTGGTQGDWVEVSVTVKVTASVTVSDIASASNCGVVSPTHITLMKGDPYTFSIYPNDGYDVAAVRYAMEDSPEVEILKGDSQGRLKEITDSNINGESKQAAQTFQVSQIGNVASVVGAQVASTVPVLGALPGMAEKAHADGNTIYGYRLLVDEIKSNIDIYVDFEPVEGKTWGERGTASIGTSAGGIVSPIGEFTLPAGATVNTELYVRPDAGYKLAHLWYEDADGNKSDAIGTYNPAISIVTVPLQAGMNVYAEFVRDFVEIEIDGEGYDEDSPSTLAGTIYPNGKIQVSPDEVTTLYAFPESYIEDGETKYYRFLGVEITYKDGTTLEVDAAEPDRPFECDLEDIEEGMVVTPIFVKDDDAPKPPESYLVKVAATQNGSVVPSGEMRYPKTATPMYSFHPDDGYMVDTIKFYNMKNPSYGSNKEAALIEEINGFADGFDNTYTFNGLSTDIELVVTFKEMKFHTITLYAEDGGDLLVDHLGTSAVLTVLDGQHLEVTVAPHDGYVADVVEYISGTYEPSGLFSASATKDHGFAFDRTSSIASFTAVEDATIHATYKVASLDNPNPDDPDDPYANYDFWIVATAGDNGRVEPSGAIGADAGKDYVFTFQPYIGYQVKRVVVDDVEFTGVRSQWLFQNVDANHKLYVEFEPQQAGGSSDSTNRIIRRLQSLASTGDLQAMSAVALLAVACGAAGFAMLSRNRRKEIAASHGKHAE